MRKFNLPKYNRYGTELRTTKFSSHAPICILLSGDIATNPGPNTAPSTVLNVLYLNARSIKVFIPLDDDPSRKICKMSILQELVYDNDYDAVAICETWLNDSVMSAGILTGYNIYRKDRPGRTGGGVLIAVKSDIRSSHRKNLERDNIEFAVFELVKDSTKSVTLYIVYLPELRHDELHQLNLSLQGKPESACVVVVGDFNLPTLNWSPDESVLHYTGGSTENSELCVLMKDNFLQQFIRGPTHIAGNKLDLLLSNSPEIIDNISTFTLVESKFPSDHYLVNFSLRLKFRRAVSVKRKSYSYMRAKFEYLRFCLQRLSPEMFETNDVDIYWSQWKDLFLGEVQKCVPVKVIQDTNSLP